MISFEYFSGQLWVERLGWTLIHFVWQGALIALLYAIARISLRESKPPRPRCLLACLALAAMVVAAAVTFVLLDKPAAHVVVGIPDTNISSDPVPAAGGIPFRTVPDSAAPAWHDSAMPILVTIWFAGAAILWLRLIAGCVSAFRLRSACIRPAPREWQLRLDSLRARISISRPVTLCVSAAVRVPVVMGWLRPVVLVPVGALTGLAPACVEAVLAHELAHVRRYDYLVNIAQKICEALLFYHPAIWWVSSHIREERELCCDDVAVSIHGDRFVYAQALASLELERSTHFIPALAANGGFLRGRIARLLGQSIPAPREFSGSGLLAGTILAVLAACGLWAQTADARPKFEVSSVKANRSGTGVDRINIKDGSLVIENVSLQRLIGMAHGVPEGRNYLFSGPEWLESENFDVLAKYPPGTPNPQILQMLQRELEERFSLRLHRETKEFSAYALILAKDGPKLKTSARQGGYKFRMLNGHAEGSAISMGLLADRMSRPDFQLGRQVVDQTGLTGIYDVTLDWKLDAAQPDATPEGPAASFFTAIQEQLGLKLEPRKIPLEVLVVDRANKTPTEN